MFRKTKFAFACGLFVLAAGCSEETADKPAANNSNQTATTPQGGSEGHSHGKGPHGGAVADWGGGAYHVEFMVNHQTQEATVYVLGSDAKTAAPIKSDKLLLSIPSLPFRWT